MSALLELLVLYFKFFQAYCADVFIIPWSSPLLLSHKDMGRLGLNYQSLRKIIERSATGYTEPVHMHGNVLWLIFGNPTYFSEAQLRATHRNPGHPAEEKHMRS